MGAAISATARGTVNAATNSGILTNRIVIDMSSEIALLKPRISPLTVITKRMNTRPTTSYKFEWMEDTMMARWSAINNTGGAYTDSTTAIVVDDGTIVAIGDLVKSVATGEVMAVTGISSNTLTITRGYGETAAATASVANDVKLLVVGNVNIQGGVAPAEKYNQPTASYNYTQIFKTPFSVTNTLEAMKLYGPSELSRLQAKKGVEHAMSLEYAFLFGERKLDLTGAQPATTTGGVLKFLAGTTNVQSAAASASDATVEEAIDEWVADLFIYGSDNKVWFCSSEIISRVNKIAKANLSLVQGDMDKTYGINILKWMTPHGTLNMVQHPLLVEGYSKYSFALDMDNCAYRPLTGRDTKLLTNIQANDEDGRRDMYQTEAGLEIKSPLTHGIFSLT